MKNFFNDSRGSLTLEATVVFPFFLVFVILLVSFINLAMVSLAMDHAVNETTKQLAAHAYPLKYLKSQFMMSKISFPAISKLTEGTGYSESAEPANQLSRAGSEIISQIIGKALEQGTGFVLEPVVREIAKTKIKEYYAIGFTNLADFKIEQIKIFDPNNGTGAGDSINGMPLNREDIALVVQYKVKIPVPFLSGNEVTLYSTAVERAWTDD